MSDSLKSAYIPAVYSKKGGNITLGTNPHEVMEALYLSGMSVFDIALNLGFERDEVRKVLGITSFSDNYSPHPIDHAAQLDILNRYTDFGVVAQSLIVSQKKRASAYTNLEATALKVGQQLLDYYKEVDCGDTGVDKLKLEIVDKLLNKTQQARASLIDEYAELNTKFITTNTEQKDSVQIEIVEVKDA